MYLLVVIETDKTYCEEYARYIHIIKIMTLLNNESKNFFWKIFLKLGSNCVIISEFTVCLFYAKSTLKLRNTQTLYIKYVIIFYLFIYLLHISVCLCTWEFIFDVISTFETCVIPCRAF